MKPVYRRDYRSETASHFSSFPQTEQSQRILGRNRQTLKNIADQTTQKISSEARSKVRGMLLGGKVNIFI
nr:hypothetical protein [Desulfobulbaceae bacterium]